MCGDSAPPPSQGVTATALVQAQDEGLVMCAQHPMFTQLNDLMLFCLGSLNHFEQGSLDFHFALGTPNPVASPVLALDTGPVGQDCVQSMSLEFCCLGRPWTEL